MSKKDFRKQYRLQSWMEAIRDQKASGLTIQQWCEQHQVTKYQFYYRQRMVRAAMADFLGEHVAGDIYLTGPARPDSMTPAICKKETIPVKADFVQVPPSLLPEPASAVMRVRRGNVILDRFFRGRVDAPITEHAPPRSGRAALVGRRVPHETRPQ